MKMAMGRINVFGVTVSAVLGLAVMLGAARAASPAEWVDVKSSLSGRVLEDRLVKVGDTVEGAQPLVYVRTSLTGAIGVAARAPRDGAVREVLVKPGQRVERGEIVVRFQPK